MSIFLPPVEIELAPGLIRWEFTLLGERGFSFHPTILTYNKASVKKKGHEEAAINGVFVLVDPKENTNKKFGIAVGYPEVGNTKSTKEMKEPPNLMEYTHELVRNSEPRELPNWKKAILVCDWEDDIRNRTAKSRNQGKSYRKTVIDNTMKEEVRHLSKILRTEIKDSRTLNCNVVGEGKENYFLPNPDSQRYEYYVGIVKEVLRIITRQ